MDLTQLWLPIVVSGVALFVASFVTWAILPFHHSEFKSLPDEDGIRAMIASKGMAPGSYSFPFCTDMKTMKDPAVAAKMKSTPMGVLILWPGRRSMPLCMFATVIFFTISSALVAYICTLSLKPGADFMSVMRVAGTAGLMAFGLASVPHGIWFNKPVKSMALDFVDAVIYAAVCGAVFGAMWPKM